MTVRATNPTELHARLEEWVRDHNSRGFIPAHAAIRLGALDTLYRLVDDGLIQPDRLGWTLTTTTKGTTP